MQEAVQQASGVGQDTWLHWAAVIISFTTLLCIVGFRIWDSRRHLGITFWVDRTGSESRTGSKSPVLFFRVANNSKTPMYVTRGYLEYGDGQHVRLMVSGGGGAFGVGTYRGRNRYQLPPRVPLVFEYSMVELAKSLLDEGCEEPIRLTFVTYEGTEKRREKILLLRGLEQWSKEGNGPCPLELLPWYQRWYRLF